MTDALTAVGMRVGEDRLEATLRAFVDRFPTAAAHRPG